MPRGLHKFVQIYLHQIVWILALLFFTLCVSIWTVPLMIPSTVPCASNWASPLFEVLQYLAIIITQWYNLVRHENQSKMSLVNSKFDCFHSSITYICKCTSRSSILLLVGSRANGSGRGVVGGLKPLPGN